MYQIIKKHNLKAATKTKEYKSYRETIGKAVDKLLARVYMNDKLYINMDTDITKFRINSGKLYLPPIINFYTREILSYKEGYYIPIKVGNSK